MMATHLEDHLSPAVAIANGNGHAKNGRHKPELPSAVSAALLAQLEAVLFVAARPVSVAELVQALEVDRRAVEAALKALGSAAAERGIRLQRDGNEVQLASAPEAAAAIERFLGLEATARLSKAALETLSIVAYRQPVTRPEIDALRGVNSEATLRTLLARELVEPAGERATVGHPVEYRTTFQFLEYFGLGSLEELPSLEALGANDLTEVAPEAPGGEFDRPSDEAGDLLAAGGEPAEKGHRAA